MEALLLLSLELAFASAKLLAKDLSLAQGLLILSVILAAVYMLPR